MVGVARAAAEVAEMVGVARAVVAAVGERAGEAACRAPVRVREVAEEMGGAGPASSVPVGRSVAELLLCSATKEANAHAPCAP